MTDIVTVIERALKKAPIIPVLVIDDANEAVPLAKALVAGGLTVLEVTLRTPAAMDAIAAMTSVNGAIIGAGTLTEPIQFRAVSNAGARFAVSPGFSPELSDAASEAGIFYLPGVATASEVIAAQARGHSFLKFFPAEAAGGVPMLSALGGPFPDIIFCPTGGISVLQLAKYMALPNVLSVGGAWVAPRDLVKARDWRAITALAREAVDIAASVKN
ncbi:MAG: bifunctional 4-hydroxy-2-oxoglutarate aldolase/2-dehydro-3-deoxy-phosphogluconate aldolase [Alphaproteobacteria bacterium]|jgi:2-dehydro-3-deoxyphosphogluconate aldolase/(4S)-4-hydroxy-2-oxoglutarate aldolase|nr:bifunctional 4-hydroxy-2-oxoglutarate aldolase/2-dehydro-3-deoxy-phosphogluconate aldolase [Alphaproteobacteria bacterium]